MPRKTVKELIAADNGIEIRDWITSASIPELKEFIHTAGRLFGRATNPHII